jgi:hypothetical protein
MPAARTTAGLVSGGYGSFWFIARRPFGLEFELLLVLLVNAVSGKVS